MANVEAFETAGKEILGEWGCLPMVAFGTAKTLSAFKLLARARDLDFETANIVAKQISNYELDVKHAKENNADDPEYDVDDDVQIETYVDEKYLELIEASKKYKGIITNLSPHPCAHLLSDKDLRREIGVIRVKSKSGSKDAVYAAFIDGKTADSYNYLKADFLRVDVVRIIYNGFKEAGLPVMTVDELLDAVKDDKEVWDLYAKGFTQGLNQVERQKSAERCKIYKPRNVAELAAFVAAIRPGFKSMLDTFIHRQRFSYKIPSLDSLLVTKEIPDSFLMYDEQILRILKAAGIPGPEAYACTKAIKKKKADKVASFKERFKEGFTKVLQEQEGASEQKAHETVEKVWRIIEDAANYMFCCAHAFSMACDSLYVAWLKVHYPYELYLTMLKLWDEKHKKEKIAPIIAEMRKYKGIKLTVGRFGQDNRDWLVDKKSNTISQSLSSVSFMSKQVAKDLYIAGQKSYDTFTDVLRELQMNTCLDTRHIKILIELGYFKDFGNSKKLMNTYEEYFNGSMKLTKQVKSYEARLKACREYESSLPNLELSVQTRLNSELNYVGLCLSTDPNMPANVYFITEIDSKYGVKVTVYSIQKGGTGVVRFRKADFAKKPFEQGNCIKLIKFSKSPRYTYKDGKKIAIQGETDFWAEQYEVISSQ